MVCRTVTQTRIITSTPHNGDRIGSGILAMSTHQEAQMVSCTVCKRVKEPRAKVVVSMVFATTVGSQVIRPSSVVAKGGKARGKGQVRKGGSKGWNDRKGWTVGKGWSYGKGWNSSGKGWEQQTPAGMNNLERDSKQKEYDVLVMEREKIVRDSD